MEKLKLALTFLIMIGVIGGLLYWISNKAEKDKTDRVLRVEKIISIQKELLYKSIPIKGIVSRLTTE